MCFFFNDTATTEIYTLSLHDALPICPTFYTAPVLVAAAPPLFLLTISRCGCDPAFYTAHFLLQQRPAFFCPILVAAAPPLFILPIFCCGSTPAFYTAHFSLRQRPAFYTAHFLLRQRPAFYTAYFLLRQRPAFFCPILVAAAPPLLDRKSVV